MNQDLAAPVRARQLRRHLPGIRSNAGPASLAIYRSKLLQQYRIVIILGDCPMPYTL